MIFLSHNHSPEQNRSDFTKAHRASCMHALRIRPHTFYTHEAGWKRSLHTTSMGTAHAHQQHMISSFPYLQTESINLKTAQEWFTWSYFERLAHLPLTSAAQDKATQELKKSLEPRWAVAGSCPCSSGAGVSWAAATQATRTSLHLHLMERLCRIRTKMRK